MKFSAIKQRESTEEMEQFGTSVLHAKKVGPWPPENISMEQLVLGLAEVVIALAHRAKAEQEIRTAEQGSSIELRCLLEALDGHPSRVGESSRVWRYSRSIRFQLSEKAHLAFVRGFVANWQQILSHLRNLH